MISDQFKGMYVCIDVYVCIHVEIYKYTNIFIRKCMYVCMLLRLNKLEMLTYPRRKSGVPYPLLPSLSGFGLLQADNSSTDMYDALEDVVEERY